MKKAISILLAAALALSPGSIYAATYVNEISSGSSYSSNPYWAGDQMFSWINQGRITGVSNKAYKPDDSIKKSEFVAMINMVFGYTDTQHKKFSDVREGDWYYYEVAKAVSAGYIDTSSTSFYPNSKITREEATVMMAKLLKVEPAGYLEGATKFKDYGSIAINAREAVNAMVEAGYIGGYADHTFRPKQAMTRAELVALINKAMGRIFYEYGTYGPRSGNESMSTSVLVNAPGVTLQNMTIYGNLYLAPGIEKGDVSLYNVTVKGKIIAQGGGPNSVTLYDTTANGLEVNKKDGLIRIVAEGRTAIAKTTMLSGGTLEESRLSGTGFNDVDIKTRQNVQFLGRFGAVDIQDGVSFKLGDTSDISKLTVAKNIRKSYIDILEKSVIRDFEPGSEVDVVSRGTIMNVNINTVAQKYKLSGYMDRINLNANGYLELADGSYVSELKVGSSAAGASAYVGQNCIIERTTLQSPTTIEGKGKIYSATINASQVFIEQKVSDVRFKYGIPYAMVGGQKINENIIGGVSASDASSPQAKDTIVSLAKATVEITQGASFSYPKTVTATMGDGKLQQRLVYWNKVQIDTNVIGSTTITGRVDGFEGMAILSVEVKGKTTTPTDTDIIPTSGVSAINTSTKSFTIKLVSEPKIEVVGKQLILTRGLDNIGAICTSNKDKVLTFKIFAEDENKLSAGKYLVICPQTDIWIELQDATTSYGDVDLDLNYLLQILPGDTATQRKVEVLVYTSTPENVTVNVLGTALSYDSTTKKFTGQINTTDEAAIRAGIVISNK